jgi:transcriptional regulator with XRE-family HTH domain
MSIVTPVQMSLIPSADHLCFPDGTPDARAIRKTVFRGLDVEEVASVLGVSARTYGSWERRERSPSGAAQSLLKLAAAAPEFVREVLMADASLEGSSLVTA